MHLYATRISLTLLLVICIDYYVIGRARDSSYDDETERFDIVEHICYFSISGVIRTVAMRARTRRAERTYASPPLSARVQN